MRKATLILVLAFCMSVLLSAAAFAQDQFVANRAFILDFGTYSNKVFRQFQTNMAIQKEKKTQMIDYSGLPTEKSNFMPTVSDWALDKWEIELNSSASSVENNVKSYVKAVESKWWGTGRGKDLYKTMSVTNYGVHASTGIVLGARIHFPTHRQNCWAKIKPPFEIYAYDDKGRIANEYNGVVDNVGQIKSISVWVKGRNYKNSLAVRLKDRTGIEKEYFFGSLHFHSWRQLTWRNPNYIENPKDRLLTRLPLYPRSRPFVKFICFVVYRHMDAIGGDFIIYIRDLKMSYDKAIPEDDSGDIDDEKQWGILANRRKIAKEREMLKLAERKVLLERERKKYATVKQKQ